MGRGKRDRYMYLCVSVKKLVLFQYTLDKKPERLIN